MSIWWVAGSQVSSLHTVAYLGRALFSRGVSVKCRMCEVSVLMTKEGIGRAVRCPRCSTVGGGPSRAFPPAPGTLPCAVTIVHTQCTPHYCRREYCTLVPLLSWFDTAEVFPRIEQFTNYKLSSIAVTFGWSMTSSLVKRFFVNLYVSKFNNYSPFRFRG